MALCARENSTDQVLEAMKWYFGKQQCRSITFSETDNDFGEYFDLNVIGDDHVEVKHIVVVDDGVIVAPTPAADQTLILVPVTSGDTANEKALAMETALAAVNVRTLVTSGTIEVLNKMPGLLTAESVANITNLVIVVDQLGTGGYIGQTGEGTLTIEESVVQLLDDANGTVVLDEIITGYTANIAFTLKEMTDERWETIVGEVAGNNITVNAKTGTAYGTSKLYQSKFQYAGRLIGHPVRKLATDLTADICMLLTSPKLSSINYSGANVQEAACEFVSYKDSNAPEEANLVVRGAVHTEI